MRKIAVLLFSAALFMTCSSALAFDDDEEGSLIASLPSSPSLSVSTIPSNGDLNPYGVAFVPHGFPGGGPLKSGDILVSNFNLQGTGTTIVRVTPNGHTSTFFQGQPGLGLTTALGVLRKGLVLVGNLPTADGMWATVKQGSLLVLDRSGAQVGNLVNSALLDGPWDLAIHGHGTHPQVFVSMSSAAQLRG